MGFWNEIFDTNFSIIISIQLQENKKVFIKYTLFLIHNIFFFASAAAEGPDINFCSSIISNFFLTKPTLQSVFKSYHRPSVLGESTVVFTYNYVQKNFSPNRPYRPSLSQNENRPSLGGVYCNKFFDNKILNEFFFKIFVTPRPPRVT